MGQVRLSSEGWALEPRSKSDSSSDGAVKQLYPYLPLHHHFN
jgi:hypothetical protein